MQTLINWYKTAEVLPDAVITNRVNKDGKTFSDIQYPKLIVLLGDKPYISRYLEDEKRFEFLSKNQSPEYWTYFDNIGEGNVKEVN